MLVVQVATLLLCVLVVLVLMWLGQGGWCWWLLYPWVQNLGRHGHSQAHVHEQDAEGVC